MIIRDDYIRNFILHYSDIHDQEVSKMISSEMIPSEGDAKRLLAFIDTLFKYSTLDMEEGKIVLDELADNYDAEKASLIILNLLSYNNFEHLVNNWKC